MPMETLEKEQFIFANIFIISNRLKTACEKNTNRYNYEAMVNARDFFVYKWKKKLNANRKIDGLL